MYHPQTHSETASKYEEVMSRVQMLNVISDSNKLLREEKNTLREQASLCATNSPVILLMKVGCEIMSI